jgi:hypothetical protein
MIGLDTNVLVRYLTQDEPVATRQPTELIELRHSCAWASAAWFINLRTWSPGSGRGRFPTAAEAIANHAPPASTPDLCRPSRQ